jgi:hypothetical protein
LLSCLQVLLKQLTHIFLSKQVSHLLHTLGSLWETVKNGNFCLVTDCIYCCQICTMFLLWGLLYSFTVLCCQTNTLTWLRYSEDSVWVRSNRIAMCQKYDVGMCIPGASTVPHKGDI